MVRDNTMRWRKRIRRRGGYTARSGLRRLVLLSKASLAQDIVGNDGMSVAFCLDGFIVRFFVALRGAFLSVVLCLRSARLVVFSWRVW